MFYFTETHFSSNLKLKLYIPLLGISSSMQGPTGMRQIHGRRIMFWQRMVMTILTLMMILQRNWVSSFLDSGKLFCRCMITEEESS
jgi:hypothetical protein